MKQLHLIFLKNKTLIISLAFFIICMLLILVLSLYFGNKDKYSGSKQNPEYIVLAANPL